MSTHVKGERLRSSALGAPAFHLWRLWGIQPPFPLQPSQDFTQFLVDVVEGALPFLTLGVSGPRESWPCSCPESTSSKLGHPRGIGVEIS